MVTSQALYEEIYSTARACGRKHNAYCDAAVLSAVGSREHLHRIHAELISVRGSHNMEWMKDWARPQLAVLTGINPLEDDDDMRLIYAGREHTSYGALGPEALATYELVETRRYSDRIGRAQRYMHRGHYGASMQVPVLPFHVSETAVDPMPFDKGWSVSPVLLPWFERGAPPFKGEEGSTTLLRKLKAVQKLTTMDLNAVIRSTAIYELKKKTFADRATVRERLMSLTEPVQSLDTPAFYLLHKHATPKQKIEGMQHLCGTMAEWTADVCAWAEPIPVEAILAVRAQSLPETLYKMNWDALKHIEEDQAAHEAVLAHLLRFFGKASPMHIERCLIDHENRKRYSTPAGFETATSVQDALTYMEASRRTVTILAEDMLDACGGDRYLAALVWTAGGMKKETEKDIHYGLMKHLDVSLVDAAEKFLVQIHRSMSMSKADDIDTRDLSDVVGLVQSGKISDRTARTLAGLVTNVLNGTDDDLPY